MESENLTKQVSEIGEKLFKIFRAEIKDFRSDIVLYMSSSMSEIKKDLKLFKDEVAIKLDKHEEILKEHSTDINKLKKENIKKKDFKLIFIIAIIYFIINLAILVGSKI